MASRRCSPTAWRSACSGALALVLLASCSGAGSGGGAGGGGAVSPTPSSRSIAFTEVASTAQSGYESAAIVVGTSDASRAAIARLIPSATVPSGRVLVAAFQGEQRTGGFAIHINRIERIGDRLDVYATFTEPRKDSFVTQVLTSPAHVVSIASADASGVREAVLLDDSGVERARARTT